MKGEEQNIEAGAKKEIISPLEGKYLYSVGRRKSSVAQVRLYPEGKGEYYINGKKMEQLYTKDYMQKTILEPLIATSLKDKVNFSVKIMGGGSAGQSIAIRHGLSKALVMLDANLRRTLKKAGFLTRDPRVKERKKPGLKKARRAPQWGKR
ncbi:MAG: small subunit ribosomal protein S9 [Parcubacteria group bacterium Gr01-1014_18]|nr:MAG: small subunit ribosomal protein S9 [Parcubacteria group bacterium Greene0416_36]TSC80138.1 MAG: small subunit ribosomal protein S9 [Parcubacteria group bacterium Gr01-1014_18]TSC99352.1 MAG: small subunit ribosomal protein S9 [Parcubacteria group bacterium Greene1014_20]TSD06811.1 MAG: small subunit ribosomal protein S9 [Parcubacteria group bacterium Greene0714_2]